MSESHRHDEHTHDSVPLESVDFTAEKAVHVFVVKSNMTDKHTVESILPDEVKAVYEKAPPELKEKMAAMVAKVIAMKGQVNNYISLLLTVDGAGIYRAYSTQGNEKIVSGEYTYRRAEGEKGLCREMTTEDECMDDDMIRMNLTTNETMLELRQAGGDWHGTVEYSRVFEGENALQEAREYVGAAMFDTLYPATPATASPIQAEDVEKAKPLAKEKRAALVEKFGETAIRDLEEKMHGKAKGV